MEKIRLRTPLICFL